MRDVEVAFERQAGAGERAFVEETAYESDAVGDAAGWREFGERLRGIGGPVAAGPRRLRRNRAEGEGWVSGEVGDGEHLVA